jgi:hypothetical protein
MRNKINEVYRTVSIPTNIHMGLALIEENSITISTLPIT